jgi:hypothetical protein
MSGTKTIFVGPTDNTLEVTATDTQTGPNTTVLQPTASSSLLLANVSSGQNWLHCGQVFKRWETLATA